MTAFDDNRYIFQGKGRKWLTLIKTLCLDVEWNSPKKSTKSRCGILNKRWYEKREDKNWAQLTPAVQSISITFTLNCQTIGKNTENRFKEGKIDQNQNLDPVEPKLESASSAAESLFADVEKEITLFVVYSHS